MRIIKKSIAMEKDKIVNSDKRIIAVGECTESFIKLLVASQKLAEDTFTALEGIYMGDVEPDFEADFSAHFDAIYKGLEKYIGLSVWESVSFKSNLTDTQITI